MASKYEDRLYDALREELAPLDLPMPERQYLIVEDKAWRLDFAWPQFMLAIEVDGGNWIRGSHTRASDYVRRRAIVGHNWRCYSYHTDELASAEGLREVVAEIVGLVKFQTDFHDGVHNYARSSGAQDEAGNWPWLPL